jgi:NADPH2:quinone reductase
MSEPRNRVVQVRQFGGPDELEVVDAPRSTPARGEVRVRVLATCMEYTDILIRRHFYPQTAARRLPFVMGYDVVGEIDQLGDGVSGFCSRGRKTPRELSARSATLHLVRAPQRAPDVCFANSSTSGKHKLNTI